MSISAIQAMGRALRPGGRLGLLVPARPRLFGALDRVYGHERRYTTDSLRALVQDARLRLLDLYPFNALGIPGWWVKNRTGDTRSNRARWRPTRRSCRSGDHLSGGYTCLGS